MSYITEIFERLDIQHIREFLLHGVEETEVDTRSYMERLKTPEKIMTSFLHSKFPNEKEYEGITEKVYDYASACQNVYMEIGLQGGFIQAMQMNKNTQTDNERFSLILSRINSVNSVLSVILPKIYTNYGELKILLKKDGIIYKHLKRTTGWIKKRRR